MAGQHEGRFLKIIAILLTLALLGLQRELIFRASPAVANDSVYLLRLARQMDVSWGDSIKTCYLHPGYSAMVNLAHRVLSPGSDSVASWENAGFAVAMTMSLVALLGVWCFAKMLFRKSEYAGAIGLISMIFAGIGRKMSILGGDVLSDSSAAAFAIWAAVAVVACINAIIEKKNSAAFLWAATTGILGGLAYLVRFEAIAAVAVILFFMLAWPLVKKRNAAIALLCVVVACVCVFVTVLPYTAVIGSYSNKYTLRVYETACSISGNAEMVATTTSYEADSNPLLKFISKFFEIIHPAVGVMLVLYLVSALLAKAGRKFATMKQSLPKPAALPALLAGGIFAAFAAITMLHYSKSGAFAARYLTIPVMLVVPFAAAEIPAIMVFLGRIWNPKAGKIAAAAIMLGLTFGMGIHATVPWHEDHVNMKLAAEFLRENTNSQPALADCLIIHYYADSPNVASFDDEHLAYVTAHPAAKSQGYTRKDTFRNEISRKEQPYEWVTVTLSPDEKLPPEQAEELAKNGYTLVKTFSQQHDADVVELYRRGK